jgi:hypoxanthine phosphoribosyltransferase
MKILISESEIQDRVRQLGSEISQDYNARMPTLVCVLKGSIIFFADAVRAITLDVTCEFVQISSYEDKSVSSGEANLVFNSQPNLANTDVIIIEDIIDTGLSLTSLIDEIQRTTPASLKICSLLNKPSRRIKPVQIDYLGFEIDNHFVVGYGLDYAQRYRNLPYIAILDPNEIKAQII